MMNVLKMWKNHSLYQCFKYGYHQNSKIIPILNGVTIVQRHYSTKNNPSISKGFNVESLVEVSQHLGISAEELNHAVNESPAILKTSPCQFEKCFSELLDNGFTSQDCLKMITVYPDLLRVKLKSISSSVEHWNNSQLGSNRVISLLKRCPHLLCIELCEIPRRIPLLQSLSSEKNVTNLLKNSPNLMFEKWSTIVAKMEYLEKVMKVNKKQIINTYALNRTLTTIKTRHVFLERCGLYVVSKDKVDPDEPSKNPPLSSITDTDDNVFVTQVAHLTLEEYEVFQELYSAELLEAEQEDNSDSDGE